MAKPCRITSEYEAAQSKKRKAAATKVEKREKKKARLVEDAVRAAVLAEALLEVNGDINEALVDGKKFQKADYQVLVTEGSLGGLTGKEKLPVLKETVEKEIANMSIEVFHALYVSPAMPMIGY